MLLLSGVILLASVSHRTHVNVLEKFHSRIKNAPAKDFELQTEFNTAYLARYDHVIIWADNSQ